MTQATASTTSHSVYGLQASARPLIPVWSSLRIVFQDPTSRSNSGSRFTHYFASPSPLQCKGTRSPYSTQHSSSAPSASLSKNWVRVPMDGQTMPKRDQVRFPARSPISPSPYALLTTCCYTTSAATRTQESFLTHPTASISYKVHQYPSRLLVFAI